MDKLLNRIRAASNELNVATCRALIEPALTRYRTDYVFRAFYAKTLARLTLYEQAHAEYEALAEEFADEWCGIFIQRGHTEMFRREYQAAAEFYQTAALIDPEYAGPKVFHADALLAGGETRQAVAAYRVALAMDGVTPFETEAREGLVAALAAMQCWREAAEVCEKLAELDATYQDRAEDLRQATEFQELPPPSLAQVREAVAGISTEYSASCCVLAKTWASIDDEIPLGKALGFAVAFAENKITNRATELFRYCEQNGTEDIVFRARLGRGGMLTEMGQYEAAAAVLGKANDQRPHHATGHIYLGAVFARQGKLDAAEAAHRRGTECREGCIDEAYLNLGYVLRARNRLEEAAHCCERAIELDPHYDSAYELLADVREAIEIRKTTTARQLP